MLPVCYLRRQPTPAQAPAARASTNLSMYVVPHDQSTSWRENVSVLAYWNAPAATLFEHTHSCHTNQELFTPGTWLPVTHQSDPPSPSASLRPRGLWWYYARGCSDMYWNPGRSFVARDRLEAMLRVLMLNHSCDAGCASAILLSHVLRNPRGIWDRKHFNSSFTRSPGLRGAVEAAIASSLADATSTACPRGSPHRGASPHTAEGVAMSLASSAYFDFRLAFLLRARGYHSLQLTFQPKGGSNTFGKWHTELWDIRDISYSDQIERDFAASNGSFEVATSSEGGPQHVSRPAAAPARLEPLLRRAYEIRDVSSAEYGPTGLGANLACDGAGVRRCTAPAARSRRAKGKGCLGCEGCDAACASA